MLSGQRIKSPVNATATNINTPTGREMDERMMISMDGWMNERMDGWMDGKMIERMKDELRWMDSLEECMKRFDESMDVVFPERLNH